MKYALTLTMILSTAFVFQGCRDTETEIINEGSGGGTAEQTATVKGTVKASDGTLLEGVTVVSVPYGRDSNSRSDKRKAIEQIETDANGEFIMEDLNQGSYKLLFLASSYSKASLVIGPVDFLPDNLVAGAEGEEGHIEKSVVLESFPEQNDGDIPAVALFDPEDKKRMTEILTTAGIRYVNIRGDITVTESGEDVVIDSGALDSTIDFDSYNLLVIGHDATAYVEFDQLIAAVDEIDTFVDDGGSIFIGQLNDKSVVDTPMPFLNGDRTFILHTEKDPANDFTDGEVVAGSAGHPLLTGGVIFEGWEFIESGQQQVKTNVTFDAAVGSSFVGDNWEIIATAPLTPVESGGETVERGEDVIIAEYTDPSSGAKIVVNQAAYYQATFGDRTDDNGIQLSENVVDYIKTLNTP